MADKDYLKSYTLMNDEEKARFDRWMDLFKSITGLAISSPVQDGEVLCDNPTGGDFDKRCGAKLNRTDKLCWKCGSDEWLAPQIEELANTRKFPIPPVGSPMTKLEREEESEAMFAAEKARRLSQSMARIAQNQTHSSHITCQFCSNCSSCNLCSCKKNPGTGHLVKCICTQCRQYMYRSGMYGSRYIPPYVPPMSGQQSTKITPPVISGKFGKFLNYGPNMEIIYTSARTGQSIPIKKMSDDALATFLGMSKRLDGQYHPLLREEYERRIQDKHDRGDPIGAQRQANAMRALHDTFNPDEPPSSFYRPPDYSIIKRIYIPDDEWYRDTEKEKK